MRKVFIFMYAAICYLVFFLTLCYLVGFVTNLFVPKSIDSAEAANETPVLVSLLVNLWLLSIFGVQHSVMARHEFKKRWTKIIPQPIERSTYVLCACLAIILMIVFWQPIPYVVWSVSSAAGGHILLGASFLGWAIALVSTALINHFHLFGLNQAYDYLKSKEPKALQFRTPFLYKLVRHPLYLGFLVAFWFTPQMTVGHLFFAVVMTIYVFIGIYHEEKDLVRIYGKKYEQYRQSTPKILPYSKS